ncbi:MAG: hypothetical protein AAGA29_00720 [Planctomycetota bacterium]
MSDVDCLIASSDFNWSGETTQRLLIVNGLEAEASCKGQRSFRQKLLRLGVNELLLLNEPAGKERFIDRDLIEIEVPLAD